MISRIMKAEASGGEVVQQTSPKAWVRYEYFEKWTSLGCEKMAQTDNVLECAVKTAGVGTGFAGTVVYTKDVCNTKNAVVTRALDTSTIHLRV